MNQAKQEDAYVTLARKTIEAHVRTGNLIEVPDGLPQEMYQDRAGVFVSIKKEGRLRGCIGTLGAVQPSVAKKSSITPSAHPPRIQGFPLSRRKSWTSWLSAWMSWAKWNP